MARRPPKFTHNCRQRSRTRSPAARAVAARNPPRRLVSDAIFCLAHGGITWRALPTDFPPPTTVYDIFRR
ncbi:transposase [Nocardia nepalensis]|uniref:transposase n=1 Tax=Nocardia nepalensis TaxID=3375448 RepID=UPI003B6707BC